MCDFKSKGLCKFTFQYGSTLIIGGVIGLILYLLFTFQYGSTLIKDPKLKKYGYDKFTFQYGSTLIKAYFNNYRYCFIYIPIWFYFNMK